MKKDFSTRPEAITEQRGRDYGGFSWYEFMTAIPEPIFVVTGWKANGKENACVQSWATFVSGGIDDFVCIMGCVGKTGHMYQSLKETGGCVLNFASNDVFERCVKTIGNNAYDTDEITAAGLTAEKAVVVNAPRIKECFLNIECEFLWEHELIEGSDALTVALKAVSVSMDSDYYDHNKLGRYGKAGYLFHIHCPINPETGEDAPVGIGIVEQNHSFTWSTK
jgi:flavin reductase (DIM6/NTAB) family NADH-FMN oxidoreductase RutF